jgi:hypothetical protein
MSKHTDRFYGYQVPLSDLCTKASATTTNACYDHPSGEIGAHPVRICLPEARRILVFLSRKDVVADGSVCRGLRGS